jgi:hypothetical protein
MITTASFLYAAYTVCDPSIDLQAISDTKPCIVKTSDAFHKFFMKGFGYGLEFDLDADPHYDANGLGRLHFSGAPSALCLSTPCPKNPNFSVGEASCTSFSLCSAIKCGEEWLLGADDGSSYELEDTYSDSGLVRAELMCSFKNGATCKEIFELTDDGVAVTVVGNGDIGFALPVFDFDGEEYTDVFLKESSLSISYRGYECAYTTDGRITDLNTRVSNRNGRYRAILATSKDCLNVKIRIREIKNG